MSHETFELLDRLRQAGKRATMATLVRTAGTTPRKEGTKMFVGEAGDIFGSVTIGGCVDARVIEEASEVLGTGAPRLLNFQLGDEEAWEIGLTCGGSVDVFVEPLSPSDPDDPAARIYDAVQTEWAAGRSVALATVIGGTGSLPAPVGSRLLIGADGTLHGDQGTLADLLARELPPMIPTLSGSRTIAFDLANGTSVDVYVELFRSPASLIVFGAGAVAIPLIGFAKALGFRTVVVDARPRFANRDRFPHADDIRVGIPSEIAAETAFGPSTSAILVAHDYKYDVPILKRVLRSDAPYVGMLGSRRRGAAILQMLRDDGVGDDQLARVRVPIGLDLGGESAAEIALSIVAEVVAVSHGKSGSALSAAATASASAPVAKA
ncbi:MAG TPA: XdhC/CoxI family protein [Thermoanaerobaculia bacterium]|nr:XdhC/CoxI family protein [Thermoanaerobaculia bacterium]